MPASGMPRGGCVWGVYGHATRWVFQPQPRSSGVSMGFRGFMGGRACQPQLCSSRMSEGGGGLLNTLRLQ